MLTILVPGPAESRFRSYCSHPFVPRQQHCYLPQLLDTSSAASPRAPLSFSHESSSSSSSSSLLLAETQRNPHTHTHTHAHIHYYQPDTHQPKSDTCSHPYDSQTYAVHCPFQPPNSPFSQGMARNLAHSSTRHHKRCRRHSAPVPSFLVSPVLSRSHATTSPHIHTTLKRGSPRPWLACVDTAHASGPWTLGTGPGLWLFASAIALEQWLWGGGAGRRCPELEICAVASCASRWPAPR